MCAKCVRRSIVASAARRAVENQMCSEMRETLTARLLSSKLAMSISDVPGPAVEKIRAIYNLASDLTTPGTELTVKSGRVRLDASLLTTPLATA